MAPQYKTALVVAIAVVLLGLLVTSAIRARWKLHRIRCEIERKHGIRAVAVPNICGNLSASELLEGKTLTKELETTQSRLALK